ncbi:MAG: hypothetical protein JSU95_04665, partial [Betaproteobacteria bacterium]
MRRQVAAALVIAAAVLSSAALSEDVWGRADVARVGILSFSAVTDDPNLDSFVKLVRRDLAEHGWSEGNNLMFAYRSAGSDPSRFAKAAAELAALEVDVILANSAPALRAAYAATRTIPIVASDYTTDPIAEGYA